MAEPVPKPNHKRLKPKRGNRGKFSPKVRKEIWEYFNGMCAECSRPGQHEHHIKPKGSGKGRGVFTNGLLVCLKCHDKIHKDAQLMKKWQEWAVETRGPDYFKDKWDKEDEHYGIYM